MAELGVGYISVIPEVSKITPGIKKALDGAQPEADKSGQSMGNRISTGLTSTLKKSAVGAGVAAGGALAAGLTKGIGRLNSIEQAEAKLTGLGNSTRVVGGIMENALASVSGTAYGLEEAATASAGLVAAGVKPGKELEATLKTVADTATIAGRSMTDVGTIFGSVAARGKLQGDDMLQLMSSGVPVLQLLAEETGKTSAEISDMVSAGQVDFATFERAMRKGMGGAALEAGNTVQGALRNVGAAAGRLGATLAGPFFDQAAGAFGGVTNALDAMNQSAKPAMEQFGAWLDSEAVPALQRFGQQGVSAFKDFINSVPAQSLLQQTADGFMAVVDAGKAIAPALGSMVGSLAQASAALGLGAWQLFVTTLNVAGSAAQALSGPLQTVANFMQDHPDLVTAAVGAWLLFKKVPGYISPITEKLGTLASGFGDFRDRMNAVGPTYNKLKAWNDETGQGMSRMQMAMQATADAGTGMGQKLAAGYTQASAGFYAFAARHREAAAVAKTASLQQTDAFTSIDRIMASMGHSAAGHMGRFSAAVVGTGGAAVAGLKTAFSGLKGAAGNVMSAFGGPWAVGITAAIGLFMSQKAAADANKAALERMNEDVRDGVAAQNELQASVAGTTGALGEEGMAAAARVVKGSLAEFTAEGEKQVGWIDRLNMATVGFDETLNRIPGLATDAQVAQAAQTREMKRSKAAYDELKNAASDLGIPMSELNNVIAEGGPEYEKLMGRLRGAGEAGNDAANNLDGARQKIEDLVNAARNADEGFMQAAEAIGVLADASSDANSKLDALESIMQVMGLAPKDAEQAMMDAAEAVDGLAESAIQAIDGTAGLGDAMLDLDGKLDPSNANARELSGALGTMREELQKVAVNGGDTSAAFENMRPELDKLQAAFGLTDEQMKRLVETNGLLPDKIDMAVEMQGMDEAYQGVAALATKLEGTPDAKQINVGILDEEARLKIESFGFKVKELPDGSSEVNVTDETARAKLDWWMINGFPQIDMANPTAKANLDASGLMFNNEYAKMQLETLNLKRPTPLANMDIGMLNGAQIDALNKVGLLNGQRPTPAASMNIDQLSTEQQQALAKVFDLADERPRPVADLNVDGVRDGAREANDHIGGIKGKTVSVVFKAIYEGFKNLTGQGDGGYTGGHFDGKHFPRFATGGHSGYRLPTSGPGTNVVDGFTAFNRDMVPAARLDAGEWVINGRSSEKYNRELAQINAGTFPKLPGYADGGRVKHASEIDQFARGIEGKPYVWGGVNWGDCSGAMAAIARFAVGLEPFAARFATGNQREALAAMGFQPGRGGPGDLRFGWYNGGPAGGHTSGTLPNGVNVEMGGGRGNGQYGGSAAPSDHPQYTDHAHMPVPTAWGVSDIIGGDFNIPGNKTYGAAGETSTGGTSASSTEMQGPTSWSDVAGQAASAWAKGQVTDALGVFGLSDTPPALQAYQQYQAALKQQQSKPVSDAGQTNASQAPPNLDLPDSINRTVKIAYDPAGGAGQWKSTVEIALQRTNLALANTARTIDQIGIESNGDPNATNGWDSNAQKGDPSIGLLQVIGSTFRAHRDASLPNDQRHPLANVVAALNYVKSEYGGPENIWPTRNGYKAGGWTGNLGINDVAGLVHGQEFVVNAANAAKNLGLLTAMNAGAPVGELVSAAAQVTGAIADAPMSASVQPLASQPVQNTFIAANPEEMYRMYRREAARQSRGKVGAR